MWEEYAKSVGKTTNQLTQQEKIQAEVAGIIEATKFQMNDASNYMNTYAGRMARLSASFTNLKAKIGGVVKVFASIFIPIVQACINVITKFVDKIIRLLASFGVQVDVLDQLAGSSEATFGGMADEAGDATDGVKELNKQINNLMGFDEINLLGKETTDTLDSGVGNIGGGVSDVQTMIPNGEIDVKINLDVGILDVAKKKLKEFKDAITNAINENVLLKKTFEAIVFLIDRIKTGITEAFAEGFTGNFVSETRNIFEQLGREVNNYKERIITAFSSIGNSLIDIFWGILFGLGNNIESLLKFLSSLVGSFFSLGGSFGVGLVEGFDTYLKNNKNFITRVVTEQFNAMGEVYNKLREFVVSATYILQEPIGIVGNTISQVAGYLFNAYLYCKDLFTKLGRDILNIFVKPLSDNKGILKDILVYGLGSINLVVLALSSLLTSVMETVLDMYDNHIKPFMDSLAEGISELANVWLTAYQNYLAPVINFLAYNIAIVVGSYLVPFIQSIIGLIGSLFDLLKELWEKALQPICKWLINVLMPIVSDVLFVIIVAVTNLVKTILDIGKKVVNVIKGIIDLIVGILTWDIDKQSSAILSIIENTLGAIWSFIKGIFQGIIDTIVGAMMFVESIVVNILGSILGIFNDIGNALRDVVILVFDKIVEKVSNALELVWNTIKSIFDTIWNFLKPILTTIGDFFKTIWNAILNTIKTVLNAIWNAIKTVWNGISNTVKSVMNGISNVIRNIWNGVCNTLGNTLRNLGNLFSNIFNGIKNTISNVFNGIKEIFNGIINFVTGIFTGAWDKAWTNVKNIFKNIFETLGGIFKGAINIVIKSINWVENCSFTQKCVLKNQSKSVNSKDIKSKKNIKIYIDFILSWCYTYINKRDRRCVV